MGGAAAAVAALFAGRRRRNGPPAGGRSGGDADLDVDDAIMAGGCGAGSAVRVRVRKKPKEGLRPGPGARGGKHHCPPDRTSSGAGVSLPVESSQPWLPPEKTFPFGSESQNSRHSLRFPWKVALDRSPPHMHDRCGATFSADPGFGMQAGSPATFLIGFCRKAGLYRTVPYNTYRNICRDLPHQLPCPECSHSQAHRRGSRFPALERVSRACFRDRENDSLRSFHNRAPRLLDYPYIP
jgi:hypothetical protein